jgi:hypothetical protein
LEQRGTVTPERYGRVVWDGSLRSSVLLSFVYQIVISILYVFISTRIVHECHIVFPVRPSEFSDSQNTEI